MALICVVVVEDRGWWYVGRPTVEDLRVDLRAVMSRRPNYSYNRDWDTSQQARADAFL